MNDRSCYNCKHLLVEDETDTWLRVGEKEYYCNNENIVINPDDLDCGQLDPNRMEYYAEDCPEFEQVNTKNNQMITVGQLKEILAEHDDDRVVILSSDAEGNRFSPLANDAIWSGAYRPKNTWSGESGLDVLTNEDIESGYSEDDVITDGVKALFLVPIC